MKKYFHFIVSILVWVFCFREFLANKLPFTSDAGAYYEHIRFFIENIGRGVYPYWDPHHQVPVEFFLRRFGNFNPFFMLILLINHLGVPYDIAYRIFLVFYYFVGMTGFYLLAKRLWNHQAVAFTAYLLLAFSSLGARMVDSYILLVFVAMVWFFYFLIAFTQDLEKKQFLGVTFSLMILVTTYIPMYFLVIALTFLITFLVVYLSEIKQVLQRYWGFIVQHKAFTALCAAVLILALIVPLLFYAEAGKGEFVLPMRNADTAGGHTLTVSLDKVTWWGIPEELMFSSYFMFDQLPFFQSAIFYIPLFGYILFLVGMITKMNKKLVFLALWGLIILLINLPLGTPVYTFLYEHIFIFKYFRNLHFFLWIILLPIFIMFVAGQFGHFLAMEPKTRKEKGLLMIFLAVVHLGVAVFHWLQGSQSFTSYAVIFLSFVFFLNNFFFGQKIRNSAVLLVLILIVVFEPLEVYFYFVKNSRDPDRLIQVSQQPESAKLKLPEEQNIIDNPPPPPLPKPSAAAMYYGVGWFNVLVENLEPSIWNQYRQEKFLVYDYVEVIADREIDFKKIGESLKSERNVAYIALDGKEYGGPLPPRSFSRRRALPGDTPELQVTELNTNTVRIKTRFTVPQFLVYNDSFYSGWRASINGKPVDIWRSNVAFKGVWVPPGNNVLYFQFGTSAKTIFNVFLMGVFCSAFLGIFWLYVGPLIRRTG